MRFAYRGLILGSALLGLCTSGVSAQTVSFDGPPVLGDRRITWAWDPIPDLDPFFQGNTILELVHETPSAVPGGLRILRSNADGSVLYAVGTQGDRVYVLNAETGNATKTLQAPPSTLLDLDIHDSELIVLGGLEDGRIAVWDLRNAPPVVPMIYSAQTGRCEHVRFMVSSSDPAEQRFVSAGDEGIVRVWTGPGSLLREIPTSERPATSIGLTQSGSLLVVGDPSGMIRIYEPTRGQLRQRLDHHSAAVVQVRFSKDSQRFVAADELGKIIVWSTSRWDEPAFTIQVDDPVGVQIGVRDPDAALIYTLDAGGYFQLYDGFDGRLYRASDLVADGAPEAYGYSQLGRRIFLGLADQRIRTYRTGFCVPSQVDTVCFGGYKIWRNETPTSENAALLRIYGFGDSTWSFRGPDRLFTDPDSLIPRGARSQEELAGPHDGMPYYYSVTAFQRRYLSGSIFDVFLNSVEEGFFRLDPAGDPTPVYAHGPDRQENPLLSEVIVVPNPYEAGEVPWDRELGEHVEFRNLPAQATIRIYTVAGDLLRIVEHATGQFGEPTDSRSWDLRNAQGERVASGVYIYHVTTTLGREETTGYFIVVR